MGFPVVSFLLAYNCLALGELSLCCYPVAVVAVITVVTAVALVVVAKVAVAEVALSFFCCCCSYCSRCCCSCCSRCCCSCCSRCCCSCCQRCCCCCCLNFYVYHSCAYGCRSFKYYCASCQRKFVSSCVAALVTPPAI